LVWLSLPVLSLVFLFVAPAGWVAVGYQGLMLAAIAVLGVKLLGREGTRSRKTAGAFVWLALATGALYQVVPAVYAASQWPGPPPFTGVLFNMGEALVVLSPFALWWAYGRDASWRQWVYAAGPALALLAMHFANPALTGIMAIWSIGLTLYLPWPLYAVSLWLAGVTVLVTRRRNEAIGWAQLLLLAGGYTPQFSTQAFVGLIALWLLAAPDPPQVPCPPAATPVGAYLLRPHANRRGAVP
jgi:hypothetical protein